MDPTKREEIRRRIGEITVWKRGDQRAPHKPLLLLMALARCSRGEERLISFAEVDAKLSQLLEEFGPPRKSHHPEYPFWRLQNDGIWVVTDADKLETRKGNRDAKKSELLKHDVKGGLTPELDAALRSDGDLLTDIVDDILAAHFPDSIHEDILSAVGLDAGGRRRAYRLSEDRHVLVSERVNGSRGVQEWLLSYHGHQIRLPQRVEYAIEENYIHWHVREVFKGKALPV